MNATSGKSEMRRRLLAARAALPVDARQRAGSAVADRVLALSSVAAAGVVAAYASFGSELPTAALLEALVGRGAVVLLPVSLADGGLGWRAYAGAAALVAGPRGAPEPAGPDRSLSDADVVLAPGVGFTRDGGRLGRGGGAYDRALAERRPGVAVIGLGYDESVVESLPVEPHDVHVDVVVTPTAVWLAGRERG